MTADTLVTFLIVFGFIGLMYKVTFGNSTSELGNTDDSTQTAIDLINRGKVPEGLSMLEGLVEEGDYMAAVILAELMSKFSSDDVQDEKETPAYWYIKAASLDAEYAQLFMLMLENDRLPNGNHWDDAEDKLEELLTTAALDGDTEAQAKLGEFYYKRPKYDETKAKALQWLETAAESDCPSALHLLGEHYHNLYVDEGQDPASLLAKRARDYYERAHELGDALSNRPYANMLLQGIGGAANILEAEKILIEMAKVEDATFDQLELAKHYSDAKYLPKNVEQARYWYEKALENDQGSSFIKIQYADFLISHSEQDTDISQAKEIVEQYVGEWDTSAFSVLAKMHSTGRGARKDALTAAMYYDLAAKSLYSEELEKRDEAFSQLRGYEKRQVQGMVEHYLVKHPIPDEVQSEMDLTSARLTFMDDKASESDKESAIQILRRLALMGNLEAIELLPSSYASMNQTLESALWQKIAVETDTAVFGYGKEAEYQFEQQAEKLTQEQRQWLEEESKPLILLVEEALSEQD
ncbi:sel1 repeat family protein [Vibrio sp. Of7-15]|uniref:tetratricopeptide repeat protein n=1 Tax=Vibrio sp. Of7-15 TaxID=2724879 RepID=UPI001EF173C6|nr:tetratricopeptide repeat protein [Vibrio sp. Of7-15]MCG7500085.1 sel1 repeat family protein [Vibrio sp. Of7-15]